MDKRENSELCVNLNPIALEADIAYFGARMEMVGEPQTCYQAAQLKVYRALEDALVETLTRLRGSGAKS